MANWPDRIPATPLFSVFAPTMNAEPDQEASEDLSVGARLLLGGFTLLIGALMVLVASPEEGDKRLFFYAFAGFCFLISFACVSKGRPRQFVGSIIGAVVFGSGVWYLASTLGADPVASTSRAEPSTLNALLFLLFFGLPGALYAWRTRFGFRKAG